MLKPALQHMSFTWMSSFISPDKKIVFFDKCRHSPDKCRLLHGKYRLIHDKYRLLPDLCRLLPNKCRLLPTNVTFYLQMSSFTYKCRLLPANVEFYLQTLSFLLAVPVSPVDNSFTLRCIFPWFCGRQLLVPDLLLTGKLLQLLPTTVYSINTAPVVYWNKIISVADPDPVFWGHPDLDPVNPQKRTKYHYYIVLSKILFLVNY